MGTVSNGLMSKNKDCYRISKIYDNVGLPAIIKSNQ